MSNFEQKEFRNACGMFATGITIVTTMNADGEPVGMTANSFASVSLDPPLILWSVGEHAASYELFSNTEHFAVHILGKHQEALSNRFASRGEDKFGGIEWTAGELGSPILPDYSCAFQCKTEYAYPGGDHTILVGRVVAFDNLGGEDALLFFRGQYHTLG